MSSDHTQIPLFSTRELRHVPDRERRAQRDTRAGALVRVRAGVLADAESWSAATPEARAFARIHAVAATRRGSGIVLSHESAACLHRLSIARPWPHAVHITEPEDTGRRSGRGVVVHRAVLEPDEIVEIDGVLVTSLARTLIDLALSSTTIDALVAIDAARDRRSPRIGLDELLEALARRSPRGARRADRILAFSSEVAMSPNETCGRYAVHLLGFPEPVEQLEVRVAGGRCRYLDLGWPKHSAGLEIDGYSKYVEDSAATIWAEKEREAELADVGIRSTRIRWSDYHALARVATRVRSIGIPRQPRPIPRSLFDLP